MRKPGLPSLDDKLDEALKQTFPASDAFALFPEVSIGPVALHEPAGSQLRWPTARHEITSPTHRRRGNA
jgi:hypothetical protein